MKQISLKILNKNYNISIGNEDFYIYLQKELSLLLDTRQNIEVSHLLKAYINKCEKEYKTQKDIQNLNNKIKDTIK